ncbi:hypothetical protein GIB67_033077 [Kingdonia uniflora]|uniref:Ubiquinol oxidase n=1 Tax=Kingdonia uniflora TaxID=39325 RepID=A0A7J7MYN8_9MAGN|nr:hypothetical protein GIB67_033077 [Kingdonia uniflora]
MIFFSSSNVFRVEANVLQENEEKVVVGESFKPNSFADNEVNGSGRNSSEDSSFSSALEKWAIKIEQSINIVLTELGGNALWFDRFLAQHIAIFYYFMIVFMYALSPRMAYHFSECVEMHAFETYDKFIILKGDKLKKGPAPEVAIKYYTEGDLYMFGISLDVGALLHLIESPLVIRVRVDRSSSCKNGKSFDIVPDTD